VVKALNEFQSLEFFKIKIAGTNDLISRSAGVYERETRIQGNAILSTLYIESIDAGASVKVEYLERTTAEFDGEELLLAEHPLQTTAGNPPSKIAVSRIHNKPICRVTVKDGNAVFGVYGTVVSSTASDIDDALINDGEDFDQEDTQGMPMACYDPVLDKMFLLRCIDGAIPVSLEDVGEPLHLSVETNTIPNTIESILTTTVPAGKLRKLYSVKVVCRSYTCWTLEHEGTVIASGRTSPINETDEHTFLPRYKANAGETFVLKYRQNPDSVAAPIEAYLSGSDTTPV
jgi:hypothetical protein